ncbi:MAG: aconitase X catalytic domain-containing protein [Thermoplasmata archaeon]|jgi:predicted aconitase|nr:DUF521 domain-containing protein [Thermoplasmatales archaeon]
MMHLNREEEKILNGEMGEAKRKAMEIIVKLGDFFGAERTIEIDNAHISGISYKNIGDPGIDFLKKFSEERVMVKTTINPIGFDLDFPEFFSTDNSFISKQMEIVNIFKKMGVSPSLTCTPYYIDEIRGKQHIAWAESSAIVYANSIIGAMTNRESGISALASAITGKSAYYGLHLREGRMATHRVILDFKPSHFEHSVIGLYIGLNIKNGIPYIKGVSGNLDALKSLGASMNSTGSIPMFHAEGITPEWREAGEGGEIIHIGREDIHALRESYSIDTDPDAVMIGCPHLSVDELLAIAEYLKNRRVKDKKRLLLFTSRHIRNKIPSVISEIEKRGAKVFSDTCMVVSPLSSDYVSVGLSSGKATFYLGREKIKVVFADMETLMGMVTYED